MAEIIELRPGINVADEDRPVKTGERGSYCAHHRTELDHVARRVRCRDCEREVDAFEVLEMLAHDWERWLHGRDAAATECRRAQANLDRIRRLEKNGKARLRRLVKKYEGEAIAALREALPYIDRERSARAGREVYSRAWAVVTRFDRERDDG